VTSSLDVLTTRKGRGIATRLYVDSGSGRLSGDRYRASCGRLTDSGSGAERDPAVQVFGVWTSHRPGAGRKGANNARRPAPVRRVAPPGVFAAWRPEGDGSRRDPVYTYRLFNLIGNPGVVLPGIRHRWRLLFQFTARDIGLRDVLPPARRAHVKTTSFRAQPPRSGSWQCKTILISLLPS
jgi:hypothetical protein